MSGALGSLVVNLALNHAQFSAGADKSEQRALEMGKRVQDTMDGLKNKLAVTAGAIAGGLATAFTVSAFKDLIAGTIESNAALHDLSIQTGATVESLSGLAAVGRYSEQSADSIGNAMNKLAKNLAGVDDDAKGTGAAIKALGLDFETFKKLSPDQQFLEIAKAMDQFKDGSGKSAVAMQLLGKEGAKMLPFFKDLAEMGELQAKVSTEQAAAADNFDDNLKKLRFSGEEWRKELAQAIIPALDDTLQAMLGVTNGVGGIREGVVNLAKDGTITEWVRTAVNGLTYVIDAAQLVASAVNLAGKAIGAQMAVAVESFMAWENAAERAQKWDFSGARKAYDEGMARIAAIKGDVQNDASSFLNQNLSGKGIRDGLAAAADGAKAATAAMREANDAKKQLFFSSKAGTEGKDADKGAAAAFNDRLNAEIEAIKGRDRLQIQQTKETVDEITSLRKQGALGEIDAIERVAEAEIASLAASKAALVEELAISEGKKNGAKDVAATKAKIAEVEEKIKAREKQQARDLQETYHQYDEAADKRLDARLKDTYALQEQLEGLQLEGASIGKTAEEVRALDAARVEEMATAKERLAVTLRTRDGNNAEAEQLEKQAALLRQIAGQKGANSLAKEASDQWKQFTDSLYNGLTDSLFRAFENGGSFFKTFWASLKNTLKTSVLKFAIQGVFGGIGQLFSLGSAAGAAGGEGGGLGTLSSLYGFGRNVYNGVSSMTSGGTFMNGFTGGGGGAAGAAGGGSGMSTAAVTGATAAAAALAIFALVGGFGSNRVVGGGLAGRVGEGSSNVSAYEITRFSGSAIGGPEYGARERDVDPAQRDAVQTALNGLYSSNRDRARMLGLDGSRLDGFTTRFGNDLIHPDLARRASLGNVIGGPGDSSKNPNYGINLDGLSAEDAQKKIADAIKKVDDDIAKEILGMWAYRPVQQLTARWVEEDTSVLRTDQEGNAYSGPARGSYDVTEETVMERYEIENENSKYIREGESASEALSRLATSLSGVNAIFGQLGHTMLDASLAGANMASQLVDAFGGMDKFAEATGSYYDTYYSEEEKLGKLREQLVGSFAALNTTMPTTRDEFRALVDEASKHLDTEQGRAFYAGLLNLNQAFAAVVPAAEQAADAVNAMAGRLASRREDIQAEIDELNGNNRARLDLQRGREYAELLTIDPTGKLAALADELWHLQDAASAATEATRLEAEAKAEAENARDRAFSALEQAVAAEKQLWHARIDVASQSVTTLSAAVGLLRDNVRSLYGEMAETAAMQTADGQAFIARALASARSTGYLPDTDALRDAIGGARGGLDERNFATVEDMDGARLLLASQLAELADLTGGQLTTAEKDLKLAERQVAALDETLDYWKRQIDLANGNLAATLSVADAIRALQSAMFGTPAGPGAAGGSASGAVFGGSATGGGMQKPYGTFGSRYQRETFFGGDSFTSDVTDEAEIARLDKVASIRSTFDGTGDVRGLLEAVRAGGGSLSDLQAITGFKYADWAAAADSVGMPRFARGGFHAGGMAMVGEEGPELVDFTAPARIYTASDTRRMLGTRESVNTQRLEALVERLIEKVADLEGPARATALNTNTLVNQNDDWEMNGTPPVREEATA